MEYILYCPTRYQSTIKGYWINENGRVFEDNIQQVFFRDIVALSDSIFQEFSYGEQACFYTKENQSAFIENVNGTREKLTKRIQYNIKGKDFERMKVFLLRKYKGFTAFENNGNYTLEIWTN